MRIKSIIRRIEKKARKCLPIFVFIRDPYFSNKNQLSDELKDYFPSDFLIIDMGHYLKNNTTPYSIDSYFLEELRSDLQSLAAGNTIELPLYDHHQMKLIAKTTMGSQKIIFIEGIYAHKIRNAISNRSQKIFLKNPK